MDRTRLQKIAAELERARMKREHWDNRVKDLERKYQEAERTCIHEMVHAANLSPEQLEELLFRAVPLVPSEDPDHPTHQKEVE